MPWKSFPNFTRLGGNGDKCSTTNFEKQAGRKLKEFEHLYHFFFRKLFDDEKIRSDGKKLKRHVKVSSITLIGLFFLIILVSFLAKLA